jgi:hypothetical protein
MMMVMMMMVVMMMKTMMVRRIMMTFSALICKSTTLFSPGESSRCKHLDRP